jgi:phage-related protein
MIDNIDILLYSRGMEDRSRPAEIHWVGDSRQVLRDWPEQIRANMGQSLRLLQQGFPAVLDVRPMQSIGKAFLS